MKLTLLKGKYQWYLPFFPDNYFDWAIVDPPYFNGPEKLGYYRNRDSFVKQKTKGVHSGGYWVNSGYPEIGDWKIPEQSYYDELCRVSKNQIIWGINYFKFEGISPGRIIWDKVNETSSFSDCEIAYISSINSVRKITFMWNGFQHGCSEDGSKMQGNKKLNEKRIHPTQKPIMLYKIIYQRFIKESGQKILDTHLGSGSNAIAAHYSNMSEFWGIELDPIYYKEFTERIERETKQLELF